MKLLLVTGSRALADTDAARAWALSVLRPAVEACQGRAGYLVVGDAPGPDTWAKELAEARGVAGRQYALNGWLSMWASNTWVSKPWHTPAGSGWRQHGPKWPLFRNATMVRWFAERCREADTVAHVVALVAPWSKTRGTEHTGRLVERAGIAVEWHACPAELGSGAGARP